MARLFLSTGACPTCGRDVARTVSTLHGVHAEVFHCPRHGRLASFVEKMSLHEWVQSRSEPVPLGAGSGLDGLAWVA